MNYDVMLKFLMNNSLFSFTIILVSFILGWVLYNNVILKNINLKDSLFEKDNLAAWIEFIGAFIFPTLFLAALAIQGSASDNIWVDLLICTGYVVVYILLFTILRVLSGFIVKYIGIEDSDGKVKLNKEIFEQSNISAALFSVMLSTVFVNIARYLDIMPGYILTSCLKISIVLIFTFITFLIYCAVLRNKTTLFKEVFVDNNAAAGVSLLGYMYAVGIILNGVITLNAEFDFWGVVVACGLSLVIFGVLNFLFKILFSHIVKVDLWKEVYEHNNVGAAIGQIALYIGIANVIIHFMM